MIRSISVLIAAAAYTNFNEFMSGEHFFNMPPTNHAVNNSASTFPIGTFSIEQTASQPPQPNQIFPQPDFFNPNQPSVLTNGLNGMNGGLNGGTTQQPFTSTTSTAANNNNTVDPNQATRETGIIEKLLVCIFELVLAMRFEEKCTKTYCE